MATPMTANERIIAYKKWGVKFEEHPGWRIAKSPYSDVWGPVHGIIIHHTGDDAPDDADERVISEGRPGLKGPLAHDGVRDDGLRDLVSANRASHAGIGSGRVLNAIRLNAAIPSPGEDNTDGNPHFYGFETYYSGNKVPTAAAYLSNVKACAAICDFHGWDPRTSIIGHKEWTTRKVDPGHLDMDEFRLAVHNFIIAFYNTPKPNPPISEDLMAKTEFFAQIEGGSWYWFKTSDRSASYLDGEIGKLSEITGIERVTEVLPAVFLKNFDEIPH